MYYLYQQKYFVNITLQELEEELIKANIEYNNEIELLRKRSTNTQSISSVATTVGGLYENIGNLGPCGEIITANSENKDLVNTLETKLNNKLGRGVSSTVKKAYYKKYKLDSSKRENTRWSIIGNCAEVRVTNNLISIYKYKYKITDLAKIEFTNARRPRTLEIDKDEVNKVIPPCNNCKIIFYGK